MNDIFYRIDGNELRLRCNQRLTAAFVGKLWKRIEGVLGSREIDSLRIDAAECLYADSTVLGQLVSIQRSLGSKSLRISNCSPEMRQILLIMGLDHLFIIEDGKFEDGGSYEILPMRVDTGAGDEDVLSAHQTLSRISPENAHRFELVIETLTKAIEEKKRRPGHKS